MYTGSANKTASGNLVTLVFKLADNCAAGTYDITIDNVEVLNIDEDPVDYAVTNGYVKVNAKTFTGLSFNDATYTYDGTAKTLAVSGVPQDATVTYESADFDADGKAIDAGTYNIKATVKKDGYNDWSDEATLTINPKTDIHSLDPYLGEVDMVLLMSVNPGFGGQKFIEATYERVRTLKAEIERQNLDLPIQVDGGVSASNAAALAEAGATILVAGSAVFKADDPAAVIAAMR